LRDAGPRPVDRQTASVVAVTPILVASANGSIHSWSINSGCFICVFSFAGDAAKSSSFRFRDDFFGFPILQHPDCIHGLVDCGSVIVIGLNHNFSK
jgi:hypothetical protein